MELLVNVINQKLKLATNLKSLVAGTQKFIKFTFNLSDDWNGLHPFAQFIQGENSYNDYLDEDNSVYLPPEIQQGICKILLYGSDGTIIATTNYIELTIDDNFLISNASSTNISQSLYDQLMEEFNRIANLDQSQYGALIAQQVSNIMAGYLSNGDLTTLTIEDGSIARTKVDSNFEATLAKADTAMQPSVYDVNGYGAYAIANGKSADVYAFADSKARIVQEDLNTTKTEIANAYTITDPSTNNPVTANNLQGSINNAIGIAKNYADSALADHRSFTTRIVTQKPAVGDPNTFYLILNEAGNGYDKWWYITDAETQESRWDCFGSATTLVVDELPQTGAADIDYILKTSNGCLYYKYINSAWNLVGGSMAEVLSTLPQTGNELTDYYIANTNGTYTHYRWINNSFKMVGANTYTKAEIDNLVSGLNSSIASVQASVNANADNISANATNITSLSNTLTSLQQTVSNIDTEGYTYSATLTHDDNGNYVYSLIETKDEEDIIKSQFILPSGGGGGGQQSTTTLTVERITSSPLVVTPTDIVRLSYSYESLDMDNEEVDGTYTWKVGGNIIATGSCVQGINIFDATDYCTIGTQKFSLTITDEGGSTAVKSWTVQKVDVRIESAFTDKITYPVGNAVNFTYTPHGSISKTVHFILDGVELSSVTTSASGTLQSYSIPAQSHGSHLLECFMTATINSIEVETEHIYKDIVWFDSTSTVPVISCIYRNNYFHVVKEPINDNLDEYYVLNNGQYTKASYKVVSNPVDSGMSTYYELSGNDYIHAVGEHVNSSKTYYVKEITSGVTYYSHNIYAKQYDTTKIPYCVFDPNTSNPTVTRTADGNSTTQSLTTNSDVWAYKTSTTGERNLVITCRNTSITITMDIAELDIDVSPVTANLAFDFNPTGLSNNSQNRLWVDSNNSNINMSVSNNFDWSNGGYQLDDDGNQYFCVKAGTTATFNYNLFATDPKTQGMEFKLIFKTANVRRADAQFLTCVDDYEGSNVGLKMNTHEAYLISSTDSLYIPYSEEDVIEFEFNINTLDQETSGATSIIMSYEDGVGMRPMIYDATHRLYQYTPTPIVVGSANCDVHIYRMKAYTSSLTDSNILSNFIADAPNADEMISRYNRNQIYDENNNLTPESVANACPDLKVIMIECPQFTNNKSNFVKYTNVRCIHKNGDPVLDNWTFTNCYHSGQGTTSNNYGYAGRNIDIICCLDGVNQYSSKITFDENYKTTLVLGDGTRFENGTGKVALSRTSVPNNWFNIKVNIASSENANNALLQKRYNDYLPYTPAAKARDPYAKNDMEFFNCVVFVKETGNANGTTVSRREFTDGNWHFYAIGNIGDSKKTDATRVNNPDDMKEFCVEISDNTLPNAAFQTGVYAEYTAVSNPNVSNIGSYYELNGSIYTLTRDTAIVSGKTYYTRGNINYAGTGTMIYPITEAQWNNANNVKRVNLQYSFDKDGTDDYKESFEFRYDMGGETRDGDTTGLSSAERTAQRERNKQIFRDFYKWVITASDADFVNQLEGWFIKESALYWYLFTERYTMIDNRSKNTFWHFGDIGVYRPVPSPSSTFMDYYYERSGEEGNYVYTLTSDTTVNSNKTYYWKYAFEMWDYDNDTAIGINNSGELTMTYGKEDIDYRTDGDASSGYIFNAADNVFWRRIRILMDSQLRAMYQTLDSSNCWSSTSLINEYDAWQSQFPEELWRLDIERKYYRTYRGEGLNAGATPSPTPRFLQEMMNGRKKYQRRQFERDQYAYMGTKYLSSSIMADHIEFRCNTPLNAVVTPNYDLTIVPYSDMYLSVTFGNTSAVQIRAKGGTSYTVKCPINGTMDDTMFIIYCASRIQALNDISACYIHDNNFSSATKLQTLIIGNATNGYQNQFLTTLNLGSAPLLESLDIRNCPNLTGSLNLSTCTNLETLRAEGTAITAVTFANYGKISTAYLPDTLVSVTMQNLNHLDNLHTSFDNLESLIVENGIFNTLALLQNTYDTVQTLRLVGIDWTVADTTLLNSILAMNSSYLSGTVYISGSIREQEKNNYQNKWSDLTVTYNQNMLVTQYLATYVNPDGTVLYETYVDQGATPPDPVTLGYINTPTQTSTAQYNYTYTGWDDINSAMLSARTITAQYSTTVRTYTVNWYLKPGVLLNSVQANYGDEVVYSGDLPTDTSGENNYQYSVFTGWNKSTGYVKGDIDVYAVWETANTLPPTTKDLSAMTCAEIYGVCQAKKAENYFSVKDHFDITLGSDFTFENVQSEVLLENCFFDGNGHRYENGVEKTNSYIDTSIKLFDADSPSFTLAVDYEFLGTTVNNGCLVSSCVNNDGEGFKLQYNSNPAIKWGDKTVTVGTSVNRNIVVLRHVKGSNTLFVYTYNKGDTTYDMTITRVESVRSSRTETSQVLTFGGIRNANGSEHGFYGKGWIYWAKIWYDDLGDNVARKLSSWIREPLRMEYIGANRYLLPNSMSNYANASFLANNSLPLLRSMNPTNDNTGGWADCEMRTFLNTRLYEALPYKWQAVIKQVSVKSSAGATSYSITSSNDKLYLAANREVGGSTGSPYVDEVDVTSTISFFANDKQRLKFCGVIVDDNPQFIVDSSEPTLLTSYTVNEGDIWVNTNNQNIGYIYMSASTIAKHTRIGFRAVSSTDNIQASDGGCWVRAYGWWGRSPYASNSAYFMGVGIYGYPYYNGNASTNLGVALGFSI